MKSRQIFTSILLILSFISHASFSQSVQHPQNIEQALASTYTVIYQNKLGRPSGTGSGFLVDVTNYGLQGCYVVTNSHVVTKISANKKLEVARIHVRQHHVFKGRKWDEDFVSQLVYNDLRADVAILKVPKCKKQKPFTLKIESEKTGQSIFVLGSPQGYPQSVTRGVVSYPSRVFNGNQVYVQTDAPINKGNSGGPLINADTFELVAMNTLITGRSGRSIASKGVVTESISFSVRAATIHQAFKNMVEMNRPSYPVFGFNFSSTNEDILNMHNYPNQLSHQEGCRGLLVGDIAQDSAAFRSGIKTDDILVTVNKKCVNSDEDFFSIMNAENANTIFEFWIWRSSEGGAFTITVDTDDKYIPLESERADSPEEARRYDGLLGFEISTETDYPTSNPIVTKVFEFSEAFWKNTLWSYRLPPKSTNGQPPRFTIPGMPQVTIRPSPVIMNGLKNANPIVGTDGKKLKAFQEILSVKDTSGRKLAVIAQASLEKFAKQAQVLNVKLVLEMRFVVLKATTFIGNDWVEEPSLTKTRLVILKPAVYQAP